MTRPKLLVGVLAAACVGTLLWYARLILVADLPRGATVATWTLWLVAAAAVVTLLAYLREFLAHRQAVGREASWKPLPGLVLLWIGGLTALVSFAFVLPDKSGAAGAETPDTATTTSTPRVVDASADTVADTVAGSTPATSVSRSRSSRTTPPAPVSTSAPPRPATTSGIPSATAAPTSSTKTRGHSGHTSTGKPTPSSSTSAPLLSITIPPPPG